MTRDIIGIVLGIVVLMYCMLQCTDPLDRTVSVSQEIKNKMRYHGIQEAFIDYNDKVYFIRNGKRINL